MGRLGTDQDRARYLAGYMQEAGDLEAWQGIYKAMEFDDKLGEQWRSLQAAALNMDRLAVLLAGVVQNRSKGEGQEALAKAAQSLPRTVMVRHQLWRGFCAHEQHPGTFR